MQELQGGFFKWREWLRPGSLAGEFIGVEMCGVDFRRVSGSIGMVLERWLVGEVNGVGDEIVRRIGSSLSMVI